MKELHEDFLYGVYYDMAGQDVTLGGYWTNPVYQKAVDYVWKEINLSVQRKVEKLRK